MRTKVIIGITLAIFLVIVALQNAEVVDINFLFWKLSMSRILVILGSFAVGLTAGLLITLFRKNPGKDQKTGI